MPFPADCSTLLCLSRLRQRFRGSAIATFYQVHTGFGHQVTCCTVLFFLPTADMKVTAEKLGLGNQPLAKSVPTRQRLIVCLRMKQTAQLTEMMDRLTDE